MVGDRLRVWLTAVALATACGCGAGEGHEAGDEADIASKGDPRGGDDEGAMSPELLRERPWEIVSNKGETYLANVFYADASENEQIIPWSLDKPAIDRLVYPTIGNPNLYVKDDASDELTMVLRIEPDAFEHLRPRLGAAEGDAPRELSVKNDDLDGFAFFLVARSARARATESPSAQSAGSGVYRIVPKQILVNAEPAGMPSVLKKRRTIRFVFDQAAMASVPPGLYDARFEVRKGGAIFANVFEHQYNAVRVFDRAPEEYSALNVTDTQVSVGLNYQTLTAEKLEEFVDGVNATDDPEVKNAAFITFNGDLHNGGSPETLRVRGVALTYQQEAKRILTALKRLDFPIFLTPGNHDGYVGLGHVPSAVATVDAKLGDGLEKVVSEQNQIAWPDFAFRDYAAYLARTDQKREGLHLDVFGGGFVRRPGVSFAESFAEVPRADRNYILYDGFYQWQKSYGPLYASWAFGRNRYLSINSYELRQHRRTGWGMYTVNYGGGIGKVQMEWIDRELSRSKTAGEDVVLLMHHDPRGGHKGKDFGYYFPLIEYRSVQQSTLNYLLNEQLAPLVCSKDELSLSVEERDSCLHDGLQEWHAPDVDFDKDGAGYFFSATELLARIAKNPHVRTLVLGHTHFNSLEVMQKGDALVPGKVSLTDDGSAARIASAEAANPVRRFAWEARLAPGESFEEDAGRASLWGPRAALGSRLTLSSFDRFRAELDTMLARATPPAMRVLRGEDDGPRELAILRLTSAANLTSQKYESKPMYGYSVLHVTKQSGASRVNRVSYYINRGGDVFQKVHTVDVDRTKSLAARGSDNPVDQLFDW